MAVDSNKEHDLISNPESMESFKEGSSVKQETMSSNTEAKQNPLEEYSSLQSDMKHSSEYILKSLKKEVIDAVDEYDIQSLYEEIDLGITVIKKEEEDFKITGLVDGTSMANAPEFNDDRGRTYLSPGNSGPSQSKIKLEPIVNVVQQHADLPRNHQQLVNKDITECTGSTSTSLLTEASEKNNSTPKPCKCDKGNLDSIGRKDYAIDYDDRETLNAISINALELQSIGENDENTTLKKQLRTYSRGKLHTCTFCAYKCFRKSVLELHLRTHSGETPYACTICNFKCSCKSVLESHLRTHSDEKSYKCTYCSFKCTDKASLKEHVINHNGGTHFTNKTLMEYLRTCKIEKVYLCHYKYCSYKNSDKCILQKHLRTHTEEKPYACDICPYKCSQKYNLTQHLRTHTGEKPYACDICPYKCSQKSTLKQHLKTHTGDKPYACDVCSYKFYFKYALEQHLRTHTGEKPYACHICPYKSSRNAGLKKHLRTHTGEKPYVCDICPYKSAFKSALKQHIRTHTGEKHVCDVCSHKFARRAGLILHTCIR